MTLIDTVSSEDVVSAGHGAPDVSRPPGVGAVRSTLLLSRRNVRKTLRVPALLAFSLAMPLMMLLLFSQVFRTVENSPDFPVGVSYIDFLLPASLAAAVMMNASNSGVGVAIDLNAGVVDRIRSMPVAGWTLLAARSLTDTLLAALGMVVVTAVAAAALGFRFHGTALDALGMFGVLVAFAWSFTWLFLYVGARLRDPEAAQIMGMMLMMPLLFASAAFVPVSTFPAALEAFAAVNPVSLTVEAARGFALGQPTGADVVQALAANGVVAAVGSVAAVRAYRRTG